MKVIGFWTFFRGGGGVDDVIVSDRLASENFSNPVLTCTHNQCFEQKQEKYYKFHMKIFTAVKCCCILHGLV